MARYISHRNGCKRGRGCTPCREAELAKRQELLPPPAPRAEQLSLDLPPVERPMHEPLDVWRKVG